MLKMRTLNTLINKGYNPPPPSPTLDTPMLAPKNLTINSQRVNKQKAHPFRDGRAATWRRRGESESSSTHATDTRHDEGSFEVMCLDELLERRFELLARLEANCVHLNRAVDRHNYWIVNNPQLRINVEYTRLAMLKAYGMHVISLQG